MSQQFAQKNIEANIKLKLNLKECHTLKQGTTPMFKVTSQVKDHIVFPLFLAHLAQRTIIKSCCYTNVPGVHHSSTIENKLFTVNIIL